MVLKQMFIIFQFIGINIIKDLNLTKNFLNNENYFSISFKYSNLSKSKKLQK